MLTVCVGALVVGLGGQATASATPPVIGGVAVSRLTTNLAKVDARVNANGEETSFYAEYGPTTSYGGSVPVSQDSDAGAAMVPVPVGERLVSLTPGTTYHFRFVARNVDGTTRSADLTFKTPAIDPPLGSGADGDRVNEWVSTVDKTEVQPNAAKLSADGNNVLYNLIGGVDASASGIFPMMRAHRTAAGWVSTSALPATDEQLDANYTPLLSSPDLTRLLVATSGTGLFGKVSPVGWAVIDENLTQTLLHTFPNNDELEVLGAPSVAGASDLSRVFVNSPQDIDPSDTNGHTDVYMLVSGSTQLVSLLPGDIVPSCGVTHGGSAGFAWDGDESQHWVAANGDTIFFESQGNVCPTDDSPRELYRRDLVGGTTTVISGPIIAGSDVGVGGNGLSGFLQAAANGTWVIYRSASRLAADDANATPDIYRWQEGEGNTCLTCVGLADANVDSSNTGAVASEDGSHVYFKSSAQLTPDAPVGGTKLYVWRTPGELRLVAPSFTGGLSPSPGSTASEVTPDGNVLAFASFASGLSADDNGGFRQFYRYDDRDGSVLCVSCPLEATPSSDLNLSFVAKFSALDAGGVLSADGHRFAFVTPESLVVQDVNGTNDLYEWHDGRVGLLTTGSAPAPLVFGESGDGRDVLFMGYGRQAPGVPDDSPQVYDARLDGGFQSTDKIKAACSGDACQGAAKAPPLGSAGPASDSVHVGGSVPNSLFAVEHPSRTRLEKFAQSGRIVLGVRLRVAGRISVLALARLDDRLQVVGRAARRVSHPGRATLRLGLSRRMVKRLAAGDAVRVSVRVGFSQSGKVQRMLLTLHRAVALGGR